MLVPFTSARTRAASVYEVAAVPGVVAIHMDWNGVFRRHPLRKPRRLRGGQHHARARFLP